MNKPNLARNRLSRFSSLVWLTILMIPAVVAGFVVYVKAELEVDRANTLRQESTLLAEELRHSSDDLTRMVRTYVATGNPLYKQHYQEILDIRDGRKPRPLDYEGVYWDLVLADDHRPRASGEAVPLLQLMRQAGFTEDEFAGLAEAKANSDALTSTEFAAMALVESTSPVVDANRHKAIVMLHDEAYHRAKAGIMQPIFALQRMVDQRTGEALHAAESNATRMRMLVIVLGALLMLLLWSTRRNLIAILGGSVNEVFAGIARLGSGDFATPLQVVEGADDSVLGWLREMQVNLARIDAERRQAEEAIRESERRFHQALDDMLEGCMLIGFDWTYLYVNEVAARHGLQPRDALIGRKMTDVYPAVHETEVFAMYRRVMEGRVPERCETSYTFPDGSTHWYKLSAVPTPEGIFVLSLDISDRRLLAERLSAANADLEKQVAQRTVELQAALDAARQASQAKSAFLSSMSHELRTPMNAILGFSQLLLMRNLPREQHAQIEEIRRAGQHLLALIDDLLDLTRIEAGQMTVACEAVDLAKLTDEALSIAKPLLAHKKLELENRMQAGAWVRADPVRLRQVIVNLLSNAAKYNREGGRISIDTSRPGGERLRLRVRDTGLGIAAEQVPRLFRTFERLGAASRGIEGTGIGLALSRQLIELMGGTIGVESRVDEGSTFWIDLPQSQVGAEAVTASGTTLPTPASDVPFEVLCIEDNPINLSVIEHLFETRPRWRLVQATTGQAGLNLVRRARPDAILLDIHLPGMDGFEVLRALRADPDTCDVPVVALSADAMPQQVERGLHAGFRDYLPKPLDLRRLMALLDGLAAEAAAASGGLGHVEPAQGRSDAAPR